MDVDVGVGVDVSVSVSGSRDEHVRAHTQTPNFCVHTRKCTYAWASMMMPSKPKKLRHAVTK